MFTNLKKESLKSMVQGNAKQVEQKQKKQPAGSRKTFLIATKMKDPKTFEQKCETVDGRILTYTPQGPGSNLRENRIAY